MDSYQRTSADSIESQIREFPQPSRMLRRHLRLFFPGQKRKRVLHKTKQHFCCQSAFKIVFAKPGSYYDYD
jgi:hypothetical protein